MPNDNSIAVIKNLELIIDVFSSLSNELNMKFYEEDSGFVNGWIADVFLTSNPNKMYFAQYRHTNDKRYFEDSLLYRVVKNKLQTYYSPYRFMPTRITTNNLALKLIRKIFDKHKNERQMKKYDLSIGQAELGVFDANIGDLFERVLFWTGSLIPMKIYEIKNGSQAVKKEIKNDSIEVPGGCGIMQMAFRGSSYELIGPPGFR